MPSGRFRGSSGTCAVVSRRQPITVLTRFAPSPTGFLHLGHVVNAIHVWGRARAASGRVLLRIEDHDRQRSRSTYEAALLDDLDWLGFQPDVYPTADFRRGRCDGRQSDRDAIYRRTLAPLVVRGLVYGCDCTRRELTGGAYNGRCRARDLPLADNLGWRVRLRESEGGDVLIRDRLGNWTYQWCVTVDDMTQQITHVIRGADLYDSQVRQVALGALIGRADPAAFLHHPLIMKTPTQKLSKSDGDSGIRELRGAGWSPARVIGHAAFRAGLQPVDVDVAADSVLRFFESRA
jgi:glutamyl-tRNA synthetase/glutamyl-Q tRNA(Asp) synthetase